MCLLAISQNKIQLQNESLPLPKAFKRKVLQTLWATKTKNEKEGGRKGGGKGREGKERRKLKTFILRARVASLGQVHGLPM